jgi:hypothetical protein
MSFTLTVSTVNGGCHNFCGWKQLTASQLWAAKLSLAVRLL